MAGIKIAVYFLIFVTYSVSATSFNSGMNLNKWAMEPGNPDLAWGPKATLNHINGDMKNISLIMPYLRISDGKIEAGFVVEGAYKDEFCRSPVFSDERYDVYVIENKKVKFTIECISRGELLVYPSSKLGLEYFINTIKNNDKVNLQHYWSGSEWDVSSVGFIPVFKSMASWNLMLSESL